MYFFESVDSSFEVKIVENIGDGVVLFPFEINVLISVLNASFVEVEVDVDVEVKVDVNNQVGDTNVLGTSDGDNDVCVVVVSWLSSSFRNEDDVIDKIGTIAVSNFGVESK